MLYGMTYPICPASDLPRPSESRLHRFLRKLWRIYRSYWLVEAERRTLDHRCDALQQLDARILGDIGAPSAFVAWRELQRTRQGASGRPWRGE